MSTQHSASHPEQTNQDTGFTSPLLFPQGPVIERKNEVNQLKRVLLTPDETRDISRCVLSGPAGTGKTILASQLCKNAGIKTAFQENIIWFDLGINPTDLLDQINEIGTAFSSSWTFEDDIPTALSRLFDLFNNTNALIILDDVQSVEQALLFSPPAKNVFILIITRSKRLAKALYAEEIALSEFTQKEARRLISLWEIQVAPDLQSPSVRIPLVLQLLCTCIKKGITLESLKAAHPGFDFFDPNLTPLELISHLWDLLLSKELLAYQTVIKALAIFPALTPLSYPVISQYLRTLLDLPKDKLENELFDTLRALHILSHRSHSNSAILSDLFIRYVEEYTDFDAQAHHAKFLELNPVDQILTNPTGTDEYIYRFLTYHLDAANQADTLFHLLLSPRWITTKIQHTNHSALQEDYRFERSERTIRVIEEAIRLSSKILSLDKSQIVIQLLARLQKLDINAIAKLADALRNYRASEKIWLDPTSVHLRMPSSSLLSVYEGHRASILSMDIHTNHILTASEDHTIKLWDISREGEPIRLSGVAGPAHLVQLAPDGKTAIAVSESTIFVWDIKSRSLTKTFSFHEARVLSILLFPDNRSLLSADESGQVYKTDLNTGEQLYTFTPEHDQTWAMVTTPEQVLAFTAGNSGTIQVWDTEQGVHKHSLIAHEDWVWDLAITEDGRYLFSASEDQTILMWDLFAGRVIRVLKGHRAGVRLLALAQEDQILISSDEEQSIIVWDISSGTILRSFTGLSSWINDFKPHPDGKGIFLASDEAELKLWSITGTRFHEDSKSHEKGVRDLVLSPGNIHLISASDDASIRKWHVQTGELTNSFHGHTDWISNLCISRSGSIVVSASFDHTAGVWDSETGHRIHSLKGHKDWVWCVAISSNNAVIASGSEDRTVRLWDSKSGSLLSSLEGHEEGVTQLLFSSDNKFLITSSLDHTIRVWDVETGAILHTLRGHTDTIRHLILSPPGQRIISASDDGSIRLWNFDLGHADEFLINDGGSVHQIHMLSDGYRLLSISADMALKVWDLVSSTPIYSLNGHASKISHLAVSNDNRFAATAGSDGKLCLWDLEFGHLTDSFYSDYPMTCCTFTSDNERLIIADAGGGIHFFDIRQQELQPQWW